MAWEKYLEEWKNDRIQPMVHEKVDRSYALNRFNYGRQIVRNLNMNLRGKKVLDVSVGSGGIACAFAKAGAEVYGLDIHDYFMKMSRQRFSDLGLNYKSIAKWKGIRIPYKNESFDFIICTDTLEHVPDWKRLIQEMCRVLKFNGRILISTERRWFPYFIWKDPHNDMPLVILMPKRIRDFIQAKILHLPLLDYHFFSRSSEIKEEFRKYMVEMRDFDNVKRENFKKTNFPKWFWRIYNLMFITLLGRKCSRCLLCNHEIPEDIAVCDDCEKNLKDDEHEDIIG